MRLGLDIGSKTIKLVLIDNDKIVKTFYKNHNGDIKSELVKIYNEITSQYGKDTIKSYGVCGSIELNDLNTIDNILASVEANRFLKSGCQNILSIGCETYSLIILDKNYNYVEHTINSLCAAGTGSFIDQQAERIGLSTEELARVAYNYKGKTPSIATRCAVFAKSDIIHSQAEGYSKEAIASGLCEGMARSLVANLIKGRDLEGNVLCIGGVSQNKKIVDEVSKLINKNIIVIPESLFFNAIGAAIIGKEKNFNIDSMINSMTKNREIRETLKIELKNYPDFKEDKFYIEDNIEITEYDSFTTNENVYIGIDIGSTSTKSIVINDKDKILLGLYTKTAGEPVKAVQKILHKINKITKDKKINILGVGTTGSGRKLIKEILNADIEINEITAHAKGATFLDPEVDTIIEIGGQDSKFTTLKNSNVVQAIMNYVCAAGTGSFIEEQAKRLGYTLDQISEIAIGKKAPFTSDRCTVYMERDLNIFLSEGFSKEEIITAVLYSVRDNYLSKVVGKTPIGEKIFFQGATARNKALVSVFQNELKKPIFVSKYCHLTGALGVSIIMKEMRIQKSNFRGMEFSFKFSNEVCELCANKCLLSIYEIDGIKTAWGLKCGRDYEDKKVKVAKKENNIEKLFYNIYYSNKKERKNNIKIGIPKILYLYEYYPLFKEYFEKLGFEVIIEEGSQNKLKDGVNLINSDFCAPIILTHGLIKSLLDKRVDYIFFPALINEENLVENNDKKFMEKKSDGYFCYYSEYAPTIINNLTTIDLQNKLISPKIEFNNTDISIVAENIANSISEKNLYTDKESLINDFITVYNDFKKRNELWKAEVSKIEKKDEKNFKIVFFGRPYIFFDKTINLNIPTSIEEKGYTILYQSGLDKDEAIYSKKLLDKMHWHYGQEILFGAEKVAKSSDMYPVFLTCFRCSPDSYLITYFKEIMSKYNKPYLIIQLDEHTSDVGYQTRIEAAIESFKIHYNSKKEIPSIISSGYKNDEIKSDYTVLLPYLSPIISELQKEAFIANGYNAIVLPLDQKIINSGYRYASGGECMPNVAIIGSIIENIKNRSYINPEKSIVYIPTVCMACNFNQYSILIELALEKSGLKEIKIANPNTLKQLPELPKELNVNLLEVNILGSILYKLYYRYHPYEIEDGITKRALDSSFLLIKEYLHNKKPLMEAAREIRKIFENIKVDLSYRKPRVGILGDLYVKYNSILNMDIYSLIEDLGGEVLIPSFTETVAHFIDADVRENNLDVKYKKGLTIFEKKYESIFKGMIDDSFEPSMDECYELMKKFGINHYIAGETSMNVGRMLYYIEHKIVDAVVHLNPVFCCPGVVSASIFRKIQKYYNIPIIDLFYDGNNKPNKQIVPQLYYLKEKRNAN